MVLKPKNHANGYTGNPAEENLPAKPIGLKISNGLTVKW